MLSFEKLGSKENWPASYQHTPCQETLQRLQNDNDYLRQLLANTPDTKFIKGLLQHSVNNVPYMQHNHGTDLARRNYDLETECYHLNCSNTQLRGVLNERYPGAMTVNFLENQLAAAIRMDEYRVVQHNRVFDKLEQHSNSMQKLADAVHGLSKQNGALIKAFDAKQAALQQVSMFHYTMSMLYIQ